MATRLASARSRSVPARVCFAAALSDALNCSPWRVMLGMNSIKVALIVIVTAAHGLISPAEAAQSGGNHMTKERETGEQDAGKPSTSTQENLVITPAGPVRKENVHRVAPNQAVRRNKDGTYTIVPKTDSH
jgi:hypothetical protein